MSQSSQIIDFDPDAYRTRGIWEGPFTSQQELVDACMVMTPEHPKWSEYFAWATARGINPDSGSLLVPVENPEWLMRGQKTLLSQTQHFAGGGKADDTPNLSFTISPDLQKAFEKTANLSPQERLKILSFAMTRETLFFKLDETWPQSKMQMVSCTAHADEAAQRNQMIQAIAPDLTSRLTYTSDWQEVQADIVHANSWLHYHLKPAAVEHHVKQMAATGARYIALSNTVVSTGDNDEYWFQRQFGGGIPVRAAPRKELFTFLEAAGYRSTLASNAPHTYDRRIKDLPERWPVEEHYLFEKS